jgi:excisionase family DNA binding protein
MLRSDEVAARLDVPVSKVYRLIRAGVLRAHKEGHTLRIYAESVRKYLAKQGR